ncbi:hypothetical protein V2550_13625 [Tenacibaculum maritimum]
MEDYNQVTIDLIQEVEEALSKNTPKSKKESLEQMEWLGVLQYKINKILDVFNPVLLVEINDLKDSLKLIKQSSEAIKKLTF